MPAKFAGKCADCGGAFLVGATITWAPGAGARHADTTVCAAVKAAPVVVVPAVTPDPALNMSGVVALLTKAKASGLKFPKARFLAPSGGELRLSVAGSGSKTPGAIQVKLGDEWLGRVSVDGSVGGPLVGMPAVLATLATIAVDPSASAAAYGKLMGHCAFCRLKLTDDRSGASVDVGYGKRCAENYGLVWRAIGKRGVLKPVVAIVATPALDGAAAV